MTLEVELQHLFVSAKQKLFSNLLSTYLSLLQMTHIPPIVSGNTLHKAFYSYYARKRNVYLTCPGACKYALI